MKYIYLKIISFIIVLTMLFSALVACASSNTEDASDSDLESSLNGSDLSAEDESGALTVFANGAYTAKIIRGELASDFEKDIYNQIKDLLKQRTGVNPSISTDFVAAGQELYNGPAIIIGETNYTESKNAYKKLSEDEASATIIGNKYVIAFSSIQSANDLIEKFKTNLNKKASEEEIVINSDWKISIKIQTTMSGNNTFDETGVLSSATLPQYDGASLGNGYDGGQGSKIYVKTGATKAKFDTFCASLASTGFKLYTKNTFGNNDYATYITKTQIVNVMFFGNISEVRIAVDKRGTGTSGFALPGLSGDNKYTKTTDPSMTLVDIDNTTWPGGLCLFYQLSDGRFFIIDSGIGANTTSRSSSKWIYNSLKKFAKDPNNIVVAGWLITHIHSDHVGGLLDLARGFRYDKSSTKIYDLDAYRQKITVEKLIYNQPSNSIMDKSGQSGRKEWINAIINGFKIKEVIKAHPGQKIYLADLEVMILGSPDLLVEKGSSITSHNEYSVSSQITFNGKTLLALGDTETQNNAKLASIYKEKLKSDIVQTTHHGYGGTGAEQVYQYCNPSIVLFPICTWQDNELVLKSPVNDFLVNKGNRAIYIAGKGNVTFDKNWKASSYYNVM